jgi:hypothetical protein
MTAPAVMALIEAAAETVLARYRDGLARPGQDAKRDATALLDSRRCTQARSHLAARADIARVFMDVSSLINSPRRRIVPAAGSFAGRTFKASLMVAVGLMLAAAPAMAEGAGEGTFYPMPHATREAVDEQHATCSVDGWWSYNRACCCTHGWCAPITRPGAVREERGGWRVTLRPGDHPNVIEPTSWFVPPGQAGRSPDGRFHFCGSGSASRCFLAPSGGM